MEMQIEIITPDATLYEGLASSVVLPGPEGFFEILDHHAPLISALSEGEMAFDTGEKTERYLIDGGAAEVRHNRVTVLVEGAKTEKA